MLNMAYMMRWQRFWLFCSWSLWSVIQLLYFLSLGLYHKFHWVRFSCLSLRSCCCFCYYYSYPTSFVVLICLFRYEMKIISLFLMVMSPLCYISCVKSIVGSLLNLSNSLYDPFCRFAKYQMYRTIVLLTNLNEVLQLVDFLDKQDFIDLSCKWIRFQLS